MACLVSEGALLECTMGLAPAPFNVLPMNQVLGCFLPLANIEDNKPFVNITPFVMCKSPANPAVAAIIASSLGSVTQGPCLPETPAPWLPGFPTVMIGPMPCVTQESKLMCAYGGVISVTAPGQMLVQAG